MERFCSKCGTLVSGEGTFCPQCGAPMESAVDMGTSAVNLNKQTNSVPAGSMPYTNSAPVQNLPAPAPAPTYQQSYTNTVPNYPQSANVQPYTNDVMSVGQWVGTIILSGLGIIGIILLFVWGFGSDTPIAKKNYAKAMLIMYAIGIGIYILAVIVMVALGIGLGSLAEYY